MSAQISYKIYIADEDFSHVQPVQDFIFLEMTEAENDIGAMVLRLPLSYTAQMVGLGVLGALDTVINCMPQVFVFIYEKSATGCCFREGYIIDRAAQVIKEDGNCFIEIEASSLDSLLTYRSVFEDEDNPQADRSGAADTVMHQVFVDQFGDASGHGPPDRNWIAAGTVADGLNSGCGAAHDPRLEFQGTLLDIFQDCADASAAAGTPVFFEMVPSFTLSPHGTLVAGLPVLFNTYCDHSGQDRSVGNAAGNAPVILSPDNGTISEMSLGPDFTADYSVGMVVGAGSGAGRPEAISIDATRVACTRWGWKESIDVDRDAEEQAEVNSAAEAFREKGKSRGGIVVGFTNTPSICFGCSADFDIGDCISVSNGAGPLCSFTTMRVVSANIRCENGQRKTKLRFEVVD